MIKTANRQKFETMLDAVSLDQEEPEQTAIVFMETGRSAREISRRRFRSIVGSYAAALKGMGLGRGDLLVIAHTQNLESIFAFWGAMLIGAIPSMFPTLTEKLDEAMYVDGLARLTELSRAAAILTTDEFAQQLSGRVACPVYGSRQLAPYFGQEPVARTGKEDPESIAFLQHSSGTTGLQKGVALSHVAVLNQIASYSDAIALNQEDVVVSWLPLYHDMGLIAGFLLPLVQGIPLILISPFDWVRRPAILFRAIDAYCGTLCWLPNFAYNHSARRIRERDLEGLSAASMRMFVNCSEPVRDDSHRIFLDRFGRLGVKEEMLAVSYAMAENTFGVTQTPPGRPPRLDLIDEQALVSNGRAIPVSSDAKGVVQVSCGPPIPGTEVKVVGRDGRSLPERQVGELAIRSNCLLSGYYRRPDLQPFDNGWFLSGDMGYMAAGEAYVVGRAKDLIINAGKNIYPQDIEAIVNQVPGVHPGRAVSFGVVDDREGTELIAVVAEVEPDAQANQMEIDRAIRRGVSRQVGVTASFVHLVGPGWLLKTSSGKLARAANRDKWLAERGS